MSDSKENITEGDPVCEKCGNLLIKESFDPGQDNSFAETKVSGGEWFCPHCQGEIDFLGEDDE